jgi:hypothetical protein
MWVTALGNRVLRGAEWELFRVGLSTHWDDIESQEDDQEPGTTGVEGFDRLSRPERLAVLAQLAMGLHDRNEPCADRTAMKAMLGIPEDYFSAVPHSPTRRELELVRADLRRTCGRPKAWLAPP